MQQNYESRIFPDIEPSIAFLVPYEQEYARMEYGRGLQYYHDRLEQLSFSGERVLDAGCGQGQWAIALAHRFSRVDALDLKPERLAVLSSVKQAMGLGNIFPFQGSIEKLPYNDNSFDAIFCYGVIMFTNLPKVLSEFYRVLQPGGRLYVCLNAEGWNHYLIEERGKDNPSLQQQARRILYSTYWMRFGEQLANAYWKDAPPWMRFLYKTLPDRFLLRLPPPGVDRIILKFLKLGKAAERKLCHDIGMLIKGVSPEDIPVDISRAYIPEDIAPRLEVAGFTDFCWAPEGFLLFSHEYKAPGMYESYYTYMLNVWEFCAVKPDKTFPSPLKTLESLTARSGLFPPAMRYPVVSSAMRPGTTLWQHWEETARYLGGKEFLASLTHAIIKGIPSETEKFRTILRFVQQKIFRDPVFQPLNPDGTLPSPLVILLSGRGRCGHCSAVLAEMLQNAGIQTEQIALERHVSLKAHVEGRWVLAEADAFKNGIIPTNRQGLSLGIDDIHSDPLWLDTFPATGWRLQKESKYALAPSGEPVRGYVAAMDWHERGYLSGYFVPEVAAAPPAIPKILRFERKRDTVFLEWTPSVFTSDPLLHYEIFVGTVSRNWAFDDLDSDVTTPLPQDIQRATSRETVFRFSAPEKTTLYASVKAIGQRALTEPTIYFWPSEESCLA